MTAESTDVLLSYGPAFPWQVFAVGVALLALALFLRRARWARWALIVCAGLCFLAAWLL